MEATTDGLVGQRPYRYSVTLTRGAKGNYQWEVTVRGDAPYEALLLELQAMEKNLFQVYGKEAKQE